jgi:hypothetical protein
VSTPGSTSWGFAVEQTPRLSGSDGCREPARFSPHDPRSKIGDAIVPTPFVVHLWIRTLVAFVDEASGEHPSQAAVQRARPKLQGAVRVMRDLAHDRVTVTFAVSEDQQDVEHSGGQR